MNPPAIVWFRRDLRLSDLPMLLEARAHAPEAVAVFVLDDALCRPSGAARTAFLAGCLRALDADLDGRLLLLAGDPAHVIPTLASQLGAGSVHVSADFGPYGATRDRNTERTLAALAEPVPLVRTGSAYAVSPGRLHTKAGGPYRVFTPFRRAWLEHGWHSPAATGPETLRWVDPANIPGRISLADAAMQLGEGWSGAQLPAPGEAAARRRWAAFRADTGPADGGVTEYHDLRDRPDLDATSRLSPYLKFGCLHPRTVLHDLRHRNDPGATTLRTEFAWRDFYADVLHHRPDTARQNFNAKFDAIEYDTGPDADAAFTAWCAGRTGYPIVDAGMRQLAAEGWMHNRLRMIVASFLTKDLHVPWWRGARYFMTQLVDGDLASNQHGWQWTAGCGTDAAPYFRVFNPVTQGERFDPTGDFVRRWVPELRGIRGKAVHQPWRLASYPELFAHDADYPPPIVEHGEQRAIALARYGRL
ncbi:MAG: deoxyribodipyrimidine photo-lyase [Gordonia sp. (in: high G+C Gram-positive bacteria)]|uniref:cryptochrome/photolyase family protein n=1 Tax=Gordonia sp. (in: high G+C Gram-positive bacteria) TaxID=84139 RepID=UPI003BB6DB7E